MTQEFIDCCDKMNRLFGGSAYLCVSCRKLATKLNGSIRDMQTKVDRMEEQLRTAQLERTAMAEKIERMEGKQDQVRHKISGMEKEIEAGMEQAMKEVKEEITVEQKQIEEKASNVVIYGIG